jgi:hypothetical protein
MSSGALEFGGRTIGAWKVSRSVPAPASIFDYRLLAEEIDAHLFSWRTLQAEKVKCLNGIER